MVDDDRIDLQTGKLFASKQYVFELLAAGILREPYHQMRKPCLKLLKKCWFLLPVNGKGG